MGGFCVESREARWGGSAWNAGKQDAACPRRTRGRAQRARGRERGGISVGAAVHLSQGGRHVHHGRLCRSETSVTVTPALRTSRAEGWRNLRLNAGTCILKNGGDLSDRNADAEHRLERVVEVGRVVVEGADETVQARRHHQRRPAGVEPHLRS